MKIMRHTFRRYQRICTLLGLFGAVMSCWNVVHAADVLSWRAVEDRRLAELRGGFDFANGLKISVGIQRAVYIDGNLVTTTSVSVPDLGRPTAAQAHALSASAGTISLVQNGPGNTFDPGPISPTTIATVVQNTLNNQSIKSLTVIDATSNSLGLLKTMNFQSAMRDALNTAAGGK
jgi:hypothetical protein